MTGQEKQSKSNDPLHGITLAMMLEYLVARLGWEELGQIIQIRCFNFEPSINSSLKFLRRTPWARAKVERLYLSYIKDNTGMEDVRALENFDLS